MKKLLLALILISATACASDLYPAMPGASFEEVEAWAQPRFASGTETPPVASAAEGEWFINTATPTQTALQIKVAGAWRSIAGGSGTSNHDELLNLDFDNSGHTGFQPSASMADYLLANTAAQEYQPIASMGVYALSSTIPDNGSFTLSGLSEKDFSSLANKPTTIAGYGLTDVASLGANTFTGNQTISDGAILEIATGSLSNLALRFRTDTNTGIWSNTGDSMSFAAGGATRMTIGPSYITLSLELTPSNIVCANTGRFAIYNVNPTSTTPAYTFKDNTNTGLGRNAVGEPSMVASGVEAMRWVLRQSMLASGTLASPSLSFMDNASTGIYLPGLNQLSIACGGTNHAFSAGGYTMPVSKYICGSANGNPYIGNYVASAGNGGAIYGYQGEPLKSGLGRYQVGQPSMIASGIEVVRFVASDTASNAQMLVSSGTYLQPGVSFIGDENTGFYNNAADQVTVSCNGGASTRFSSGGVISFQHVYTGGGNGSYPAMLAIYPTSSTPNITWSGDTNSGLGRNIPDEPSMIAGGVEAMRWTASQTLVATGSAAIPGLTFLNDSDTGIYSTTPNYLFFATQGGARGYVGPTGILSYYDIYAGGGTTGKPYMNGAIAASSTTAAFSWNYDTRSGLGRYQVGEPSMVASGTEAQRWTASGSLMLTPLVLATGTTSSAPLYLRESPNLLASITPGAMEYASHALFFTTYLVRRTVQLNQDVITSDVSAVNTSSEVVLATCTMAANFPVVGKISETHLRGTISQKVGGSALTIRMRHNGTEIASSTTAAGAIATQALNLDTMLTFRTVGAGGTYVAFTDFELPSASDMHRSTRGSINTTIANTITITAQWSSADPLNAIVIEQGYSDSIQ